MCMNFYLLYGSDKGLINKKIKDIAIKYNIDNNNIIKYNFKENFTDDILEEASMNSMFILNKLIIVETNLKEDNIEVDKIEKYMNNYNKNNIIIFLCYDDKIDTRRKIYKLFLKNGKVCEIVNSHKSVSDFVKKSLEDNDYKMNSYDITYFLDKVGNNINNIENELNKLYLYKMDDKTIDRKDIDEIVIVNEDNDFFAISDAVIKGNKKLSLDLYHEFMHKNYEVLQIIGLVANQIRFLYQVKVLYNRSYNQDEISKYLEVHPYRVKLAINNIYNYNESDLIHYLDRLAILDKKIKKGEIDKNIGFELFLLDKDL